MTLIDYQKYFHHPSNNLANNDIRGEHSEHEFGNGFVRWFDKLFDSDVIAIRELPVPGAGIADFVVVKQNKYITVNKLNTTVHAFEFKLKDWRKGLMQAHRYKYFSNASILVVPVHTIKSAQKSLDLFKKLGVGLWAFNVSSGAVTKKFTPRPRKVLNPVRAAYILDKALEVHFHN
ncbi:MAG: hypothetical protein V2B19_23915 [Pseudomonadota bacterium]